MSTADLLSRPQPLQISRAAVLGAVAVVLSIAAPRTSPFALGALAVLAVTELPWRRALWVRPGPSEFILGGLAAYLFINAAWSLAPAAALKHAGEFTAMAAGALMLRRGLAGLDGPASAGLRSGITLGVLIGAAFVSFEAVTNQLLTRLVVTALPVLNSGQSRHIVVEANGWVSSIDSFVLKRNLSALCLWLWPAVYCCRSALPERANGYLLVAVGLSLVGAIAARHDTSLLALPVSAFAYLITLRWPKTASLGLGATWVLFVLAIIPLTLTAYQLGGARWQALPNSGRHRIAIWNYQAHEALQAPLLGIGGSSIAKIQSTWGEKPSPDPTYPVIVPHSHNNFLQVWYELGIVGVVLTLVLGLRAIVVLRRPGNDRHDAAIGVATFVSFIMVASISWGLWQEWYEALVLLAFSVGPPWQLAAESRGKFKSKREDRPGLPA